MPTSDKGLISIITDGGGGLPDSAKSIRNDRNHFAKSGNLEKFSIGPISLKPGPILPSVVATALKAEKISALQKDITTVENMKMMI